MAFRIKPHKSAAKELRLTALGRLGKAREALLLPPEQQAVGIHDARKRIKETRALLRLIRKHLGDTFSAQNRHLRDINRSLSTMRDAGALMETWDALAGLDPEWFETGPMRSVRKRLEYRGEGGGHTVEEVHQVLEDVLSNVTVAEASVGTWAMRGKGFALVENGLKRTYTDGRQALSALGCSATDDELHDWRKRVKDHWYHTRLLARIWPAALQARAEMLKELSELLGDDHDLAMLTTLLDQEPELFGGAGQRVKLSKMADDRRASLQRAAYRLGKRLYAEPPAAMCKRWQRYWQLARDEKLGHS